MGAVVTKGLLTIGLLDIARLSLTAIGRADTIILVPSWSQDTRSVTADNQIREANVTSKGAMEQEQFNDLVAECMAAPRLYLREASRTCRLSTKCSPVPIPFGQQENFQTQRTRENDAHTIYQNKRERLFEALRIEKEEAENQKKENQDCS
jgi:hypothetical protein